MLCLASILSSSQQGQCGDYKAHWEVDLGGGGCTAKEMLPKQFSQPTAPLRNTTARSCLLCLYAQVSFLLQHKCSLWLCRDRDSAQTTWSGLRATTVSSVLPLLGVQGWPVGAARLFTCWLRGLVHSPAFISMTLLLYWLHEKQHSDHFHLARSLVRMRTQTILSLFYLHSICHDYAPVALGLSEI